MSVEDTLRREMPAIFKRLYLASVGASEEAINLARAQSRKLSPAQSELVMAIVETQRWLDAAGGKPREIGHAKPLEIRS